MLGGFAEIFEPVFARCRGSLSASLHRDFVRLSCNTSSIAASVVLYLGTNLLEILLASLVKTGSDRDRKRTTGSATHHKAEPEGCGTHRIPFPVTVSLMLSIIAHSLYLVKVFLKSISLDKSQVMCYTENRSSDTERFF